MEYRACMRMVLFVALWGAVTLNMYGFLVSIGRASVVNKNNNNNNQAIKRMFF